MVKQKQNNNFNDSITVPEIQFGPDLLRTELFSPESVEERDNPVPQYDSPWSPFYETKLI
jgi:hypothetical protein